jgi:hypothetical protein
VHAAGNFQYLPRQGGQLLIGLGPDVLLSPHDSLHSILVLYGPELPELPSQDVELSLDPAPQGKSKDDVENPLVRGLDLDKGLPEGGGNGMVFEVAEGVDSKSATFFQQGDNVFLEVVKNRFSPDLRYDLQFRSLGRPCWGSLRLVVDFHPEEFALALIHESVCIQISGN